jgi:hypothetical protein
MINDARDRAAPRNSPVIRRPPHPRPLLSLHSHCKRREGGDCDPHRHRVPPIKKKSEFRSVAGRVGVCACVQCSAELRCSSV